MSVTAYRHRELIASASQAWAQCARRLLPFLHAENQAISPRDSFSGELPSGRRGRRWHWVVLAAGCVLTVSSVLLAASWGTRIEPPAENRAAQIFPCCPSGPVGLGQAVVAYTDRGRPVALVAYPDRPAPSPELFAAEEQWLNDSGLSAQLTRTGPATDAYVCHDWVFTGGRYVLAGDPELILQDNGYLEVAVPQAGDLAVYRESRSGALMHTAVVRSAEPGAAVVVESKWGWMGRFLHPASVYCCPGAVCTFHHSSRPGHLLHGLGAANLMPAAIPAGG